MESNKEEASRALVRAKQCLKAGDLEKARKLTKVSLRLYSSEDAEVFMAKLDQIDESASQDPSSRSSSSDIPAQSAARHRNVHAKAPEEAPEEPQYTKEEADGVKRIILMKTHYEVLSVEKTAAEEDIKRAYKKLAIKFHPDKNKAPKSDEAFKKISKAYQILSDHETRRRYDAFGDDTDQQPVSHEGYHRTSQYGMTDQEIFEQFFGFSNRGFGGGGFQAHFGTPRTRVCYLQRNRNQERDGHFHTGGNADLPVGSLLIVLAVMLLTAMSSSFSQPDPSYTFSRGSYTTVQMRTTTTNPIFVYWAKDSFAREVRKLNSRDLQQFERNLFEEYKTELARQCHNEESNMNVLMRQATFYGDKAKLEKLKRTPLETCDRLKDLVTPPKKKVVDDEEQFIRG